MRAIYQKERDNNAWKSNKQCLKSIFAIIPDAVKKQAEDYIQPQQDMIKPQQEIDQLEKNASPQQISEKDLDLTSEPEKKYKEGRPSSASSAKRN